MANKRKLIYQKIANRLGFSDGDVEFAYNSYWQFFKDRMSELPVNEDLSEDEFNKRVRSISIYGIGKIFVPYKNYKRAIIGRRINENKKHQTDV